MDNRSYWRGQGFSPLRHSRMLLAGIYGTNNQGMINEAALCLLARK